MIRGYGKGERWRRTPGDSGVVQVLDSRDGGGLLRGERLRNKAVGLGLSLKDGALRLVLKPTKGGEGKRKARGVDGTRVSTRLTIRVANSCAIDAERLRAARRTCRRLSRREVAEDDLPRRVNELTDGTRGMSRLSRAEIRGDPCQSPLAIPSLVGVWRGLEGRLL